MLIFGYCRKKQQFEYRKLQILRKSLHIVRPLAALTFFYRLAKKVGARLLGFCFLLLLLHEITLCDFDYVFLGL